MKVGKKSPLTLARFDDFFARLPGREDSDRSWTVDLSARRAQASADARPFREAARTTVKEADGTKAVLQALKKVRPRDEAAVAAAEAKLAAAVKAARVAEGKADAIEAAVYDLKAVNPNRRATTDERTPAQLLDLIEQKGEEVRGGRRRVACVTARPGGMIDRQPTERGIRPATGRRGV